MPSVLLANMHRHLAGVVVEVGGVACSSGRGRRNGWFRRRWFSTAAATSMNRFTLDGHFEAFRLAFLASYGGEWLSISLVFALSLVRKRDSVHHS